jgi:hypothetical protein
MRTVTFADSAIVDFVNEHFVPVWNNHNPEPTASGVQAEYTPEEIAAYPEGGGAGNLVTYVVSPQGTLLAQLQGYWSPPRYQEELRWSRDLTPENAQELHVRRSESRHAEASRLAEEHPEEQQKPVRDSEVRRRIAALGLLENSHQISIATLGRAIKEILELLQWEQSERGVIR